MGTAVGIGMRASAAQSMTGVVFTASPRVQTGDKAMLENSVVR